MLYTSIENKRIKEIKKLNQKKYRDIENLYLIEGEHLVNEANKAGYLKTLILEDGITLDIDVETIYVTKEVLKYITELDTPSKIMGICEKTREKEELGNKVLILDDIQDPGNLGTIVRSAVAFNVDTIVLSDHTVDLYNSKVVRACQGMNFYINIIRRELIDFIKNIKKDYKILATNVNGGNDIKNGLEKNEKLCIIMGNEGNGVRPEILELSDEYIYIKMSFLCESLNVGVATSIILYELDK